MVKEMVYRQKVNASNVLDFQVIQLRIMVI